MKNIIFVTLCVVIVLSIWIYDNNKKNEIAVFDYSMDYIATKYYEDKILALLDTLTFFPSIKKTINHIPTEM